MTEQVQSQMQDEIKTKLFNSFAEHFDVVINDVRNLPIEDFPKVEILRWLYAGFREARDIIGSMKIDPDKLKVPEIAEVAAKA